MKSQSIYRLVVFVVALLVIISAQAWSTEILNSSVAGIVSSSITPFMVVGGISLMQDKHEFGQGVKALGATCIATELLKHAVGEKRPNSDSRTSFPSGHTSAAFAMATVLADYEPEYKWPAYAAASAIGLSRVETGSHYWRDVIGGALLGHFIAKRFTNDHIMVSPEGVGLKWQF